ncbi:MAG TPA: hypothetical protein VN281_22710 [Verrucomicrobiae bacterium]|jgi:hypothetical protein|nr:hypothetical protein [Verrucomicrobiae bacterium]
MAAKRILIVCAILLVGLIYYYLYHDSFSRRDMSIKVMVRPKLGARMRPTTTANGAENDAVIFGLSRQFQLTEVEVIPLDALATNKYAHPVWHMVSDSNSAPIMTFAYGMRIHGMHPEVKGIEADPLLPGTSYRVRIAAGADKGEHDFKTPAELAGPQ